MKFFNKNAILAFVVAFFTLFLQRAFAEEEAPKDYSLSRTMASIEKAVDSYRLVLRELENLLAQFIEEAQKEQSDSTSRHAAWRVTMQYAQKGLNNADTAELPPLLKMIHQDLLNHFADGEDFSRPSELFKELEAIILDFELIQNEIKLYEKYGKSISGVETRFKDDDEALDEIEEAVLAVQKDLIAINKAGAEDADSGEKYPLLVRLNSSLKVLLDTLAAAAESGVEIGFTPEIVSRDYSRKVELFAERLKKVKKSALNLKEKLPPYNILMTAKCLDGASEEIEVAIGVGRKATAGELLVKEPYRAFLNLKKREVQFDGLSWNEESALKEVEYRSFGGSEVLKDYLPMGKAYEYIASIETMAGFSSTLETLIVSCPVKELTAPATISAKALINGDWRDDQSRNRTDKVYRDLDVIAVSWPLSPSEEVPDKGENGALSALKYYHLYRSVSEEEFEHIATLKAGTIYYEDRVSLSRLMRSNNVRYQLEAEDRAGNRVKGPVSSVVRGDWDVWQEVALSGYFEYTDEEMDNAMSKALAEYPEYIVEAARKWLKENNESYHKALKRYWQRIPDELKIHWYNEEQKVLFEGSSLCLSEGPKEFSERDRKRVITEIWLAMQPPVVAMEPARWWQSLAQKQRTEYLNSWWQRLNPEYAAELLKKKESSVNDEMVPAVDDGESDVAPWFGMTIEALSAAVVASWYDSLDSIEAEFLEYFWQNIEEESKKIAFKEWWADQPEAYRKAACYPAFKALSREKREHFLKKGDEELSAAVLARFLPYVYFEAAPWGEKTAVIHHVEDKMRATKRHFLFTYYRPLDVICDFNLNKVLFFAILLLLTALGIRIYLKKKSSKE